MDAKMKSLLLPAVAVVLGGSAAAVYAYARDPGSTPEGVAAQALGAEHGQQPQGLAAEANAVPAAQANAVPAAEANAIAGEILERIDVGKYTYLRLGARGSDGTWTAVPSTPAKVGERVRVLDAQKMTDFQSATLKRTFPTIYFGTLDAAEVHGNGSGPSPMNPHATMGDHPGASAMNPHAAIPGHPANAGVVSGDHPSPLSSSQSIEIGKVDKAPGPLGRTVSEVYAQRQQLAGKRVRLRGVVVKAVSNVLDRTFVHLRDGTGSADAQTHDLTATLESTPRVGDRLLLEGTLAVDKDFGAGYQYRAILENATAVSE